jgi:hypothetical protein
MKAQIEEILRDNLCVTQCGVLNSSSDIAGIEDVVKQIEKLMCYREVKAIYDWVEPEYFQTDHEDGLVQQLENTYHTDLIWAAIDNCKAGNL